MHRRWQYIHICHTYMAQTCTSKHVVMKICVSLSNGSTPILCLLIFMFIICCWLLTFPLHHHRVLKKFLSFNLSEKLFFFSSLKTHLLSQHNLESYKEKSFTLGKLIVTLQKLHWVCKKDVMSQYREQK